MGRHAASAGSVGRARAARTALSRGLVFWTWSVTAAAFAGLLAASLLGPGLQRPRGDDAVTPRQVAVGESTTAAQSPTGSSTSASGSASPTAPSSPTGSVSSSPSVTSSQPVTSEPVTSPPTTAGSPDSHDSGPPAPSTASETSPVDPSPTTVAPFDPGPLLTSNAPGDDDPTTATSRSRQASTRDRADRFAEPARDRRGSAPEVAVAGRKLVAAAGDGRAVGEPRAIGSGPAPKDDRDDVARVADADTAAALPAPSRSPTAGAGGVGSFATGADAAGPDRPDVHLHLDPTRTQVAVFLGVFLTGLAASLVMTSTRSTGAHRRH